MAGSTIFTSLDLYKGYHQLELDKESIPKTCLSTPLGSYGFSALAMGLRNAGSVMCRFMNEVMRGLDFVFVYIDDILIFSQDLAEHMMHLTLVFERLREYGMILNVDKCIFAVPELQFLGH